MTYQVVGSSKNPFIVFKGPKVKQHLHLSDFVEHLVLGHTIDGIPHKGTLYSHTVSVAGGMFDVLKKG